MNKLADNRQNWNDTRTRRGVRVHEVNVDCGPCRRTIAARDENENDDNGLLISFPLSHTIKKGRQTFSTGRRRHDLRIKSFNTLN